jgi:hypothetical protein
MKSPGSFFLMTGKTFLQGYKKGHKEMPDIEPKPE